MGSVAQRHARRVEPVVGVDDVQEGPADTVELVNQDHVEGALLGVLQ